MTANDDLRTTSRTSFSPASMRLAMLTSSSRDKQRDRAHLAQVHAHRVVGLVGRVEVFAGFGLGIGALSPRSGFSSSSDSPDLARQVEVGNLLRFNDLDVVLVEEVHDVFELLRRHHVVGERAVDVIEGQNARLAARARAGRPPRRSRSRLALGRLGGLAKSGGPRGLVGHIGAGFQLLLGQHHLLLRRLLRQQLLAFVRAALFLNLLLRLSSMFFGLSLRGFTSFLGLFLRRLADFVGLALCRFTGFFGFSLGSFTSFVFFALGQLLGALFFPLGDLLKRVTARVPSLFSGAPCRVPFPS